MKAKRMQDVEKDMGGTAKEIACEEVEVEAQGI